MASRLPAAVATAAQERSEPEPNLRHDRLARVAGERVQGVRDHGRAGRGLARHRRRRPDRRGRPQRRRQDHAAARCSPAWSRRTPAGSPRPAACTVGYVDQRTRPAAARPSGTPCSPATAAEHEWAGDAAVREVLAGLGLPRIGLDSPIGRLSGGERRRVALAAAAGRPLRPAGPGRADQPPRRRGRRLAGRAPAAAPRRRWSWSPTTAGSWTRSASRPGRSATATVRRVRRRLLGVRAGPGRAGPAGRRRRGPAAEPAAQGAGLAAPRPAGPDRQAEVPDRGGQGADRRRAAAAGLDRSCRRFATAPARQGRLRRRGRHRSTRRRPHACSTTSPGGSGPATGSAWSGVNGAGKTTLLRLLLGERQPDAGRVRVGQTVRVGYLSQDVAELPGELRLLEAVSEIARQRRTWAASS